MVIQNRKRRVLNTPLDTEVVATTVIPISIEAMVLTFGGKKTYFKRLKYKGCPPCLKGSHSPDGSLPISVVNMGRDIFVREMYDLFKDISPHSQTGRNYFIQLAQYVATLDKHERMVDFTEDNIFWYLRYTGKRVLKGDIKKGTYAVARNSISALLKNMNKSSLARKLPVIRKQKESAVPYNTLSDSELTKIGKKLIKAYTAYSQFVLNNNKPKICPMFDETELKAKGFSKDQISTLRTSAIYRVAHGDWRNIVIRLAFLIVSMWTGANTTPLLQLKRKDVTFKKCDGDSYEFNSVKARALYAKQKLGIGFTKLAKEFMESWLIVSEKFAPDENEPFFPFFSPEGEVYQSRTMSKPPQCSINRALVPMGYVTINTSIFRKTRSNALMRAFGDIFIVAKANKSSVETVSKSYLYGVKETHEIQLAGAFIAQGEITSGTPKKQAIEEALYKFKDPLTNFDWQMKHKSTPNKTPTGMRCGDPYGERAKKSLRPFRELQNSESGTCVDFLSCFECENHALIAEQDDIWLMLSFKDTIIEVMAYPSLNSIPSNRLGKILNTVNAILERYNVIVPDEYKAASELNKNDPHPLYDDSSSIDDLLEIYK